MLRLHSTNDYAIHSKMTKKEITKKVMAAQNHINSMQLYYSPVKLHLLNLTLDYAKNNLCSIFARNDNRYIIYSNIINFVNYFKDDIHFLAYVAKELEEIPRSDNSTLKNKVLPFAREKLHILLAPEFSKTRKAFAGMTAFGASLLFIESKAATFFIVIGLTGFVFSEQFVYARLNASLQTKMHHYLTGETDNNVILTDGFEDIFSKLTNTSVNMLESSVTLFANASKQYQAFANSQAPSTNTPRVEALPDENTQSHTLSEGPLVMSIATTQPDNMYSYSPYSSTNHMAQPYNPLLFASAPPMEEETNISSGLSYTSWSNT